MKIGHIFLSLCGLLALAMTSACSQNPIKRVEVPSDASAIAIPFLAAIKRGDAPATEKFVARYMLDDTQDQFDDAHDALSSSPNLVPILFQPKAAPFALPDNNDVTIFYVVRKKDRWISAQVRLFRLPGEAYKVEYWNVTDETEMPDILVQSANVQKYLIWYVIGMGVLAVSFLAGLYWILRRKPHLIIPETIVNTRPSAKTTRD